MSDSESPEIVGLQKDMEWVKQSLSDSGIGITNLTSMVSDLRDDFRSSQISGERYCHTEHSAINARMGKIEGKQQADRAKTAGIAATVGLLCSALMLAFGTMLKKVMG